MYRTTTCGALRLSNVGEQVTLAGWVQKARRMGGMTFIDLRDRYGITQLVFNEAHVGEALVSEAEKLGREYVIQITGEVTERENKNPKLYGGYRDLGQDAARTQSCRGASLHYRR